jgi:hypothetical protein
MLHREGIGLDIVTDQSAPVAVPDSKKEIE